MSLEKMNKVGFINGCFDILHIGHVELLSHAKSKCDYLIVGLDSDKRVAQLKGPSRPINKLKDRIGMMTALRCVDEVRTFSTAQELEEMIKSIAPDVMMVGSDWEGKQIIGADYAAEVLFFRRIDGYSTTKTIEDISYR
jgi:rfaE bifunctional protein nucleotidyltransferase chain/domain